MERVAVVDNHAELIGDAMLAYAAAQILLRDGEHAGRPAADAHGCRAQRGVDCDVDVTVPMQAVPRVLPAAHGDKRPVTASDRPALVPVRALRPTVDARGV